MTNELTTAARRTYGPRVDVKDEADQVVLTCDMPGADPGKIDVEVREGVLYLRAEAPDRQPEGTEFLIREYGVGPFAREFRVGDEIDVKGITAGYSDGILTVQLPKAEAVKPRKISVKSM